MKFKHAPSFLISFFCLIVLRGENLEALDRWTSNGPFGGTFKLFSFDPRSPQVIFASANNGLFRSTNAGKTWERLQISGESLVLKIHPRDPDSIIAAGSSVFKSTNQGTNWERISDSPFLGEHLSDMEFDPDTPQMLYALTFRAGVFRSEDGGRTWERKSSGLDLSGCCGDPQLEVDPKNGKILYALLRSGKVFKSTNGAQSWKSVSAGLTFGKVPPVALAIDPNNPAVLFAANTTTVFKTTNGAAQWSALNCGCKVSQIAVDPNNSQVVFVSGTQISKSTNGGISWKQLRVNPTLGGLTTGIGIHPDIRNLLFVGGEGGGIFRSTTGGGRFTTVSKKLSAFVVDHVESHPQAPNRIFAQGDQQVFLSSNAGRSWKVVPAFSQSIVRDIAIHPKNPNVVVAVGKFLDEKMVAISTDGAKTWRFTGPVDPRNCSGPRSECWTGVSETVTLDPTNTNTLYVGVGTTCSVQITKSTDQGQSWKKLFPGAGTCSPVASIAIDPKDSLIVFAGSKNAMHRSVDGGLRWKRISFGPSVGNITSITFDPRDSKIVYITGDDYFGVLRSTNGGTKWDSDSIVTNYANRVTGLPNCIYGSGGTSQIPDAAGNCAYNFLQFDPADPDTLYAAGDAGLFISTDRGQKWSAFDSNGLGSSAILDILFQPSGTLSVATDQGVFSFTRTASQEGPKVIQILPSSGKIGDLVEFNGEKFGSTQGSGQVLFSGASTGNVESWSDSGIQVRIPSGAVTGEAAISTSTGRSNAFQFIVLPESETGVEPSSGPSSGGTRVAIISPENLSGSKFDVLFGSTLAKDVGFTGPNVITCSSPPGTGKVEIQVIYGLVSVSVGSFTYD